VRDSRIHTLSNHLDSPGPSQGFERKESAETSCQGSRVRVELLVQRDKVGFKLSGVHFGAKFESNREARKRCTTSEAKPRTSNAAFLDFLSLSARNSALCLTLLTPLQSLHHGELQQLALTLLANPAPLQPRSKRNTVVALTQTDKKSKAHKGELINTIREQAELFTYIWVFDVEHMRNNILQEVRTAWKGSR
jgi:hypothetical protein